MIALLLASALAGDITVLVASRDLAVGVPIAEDDLFLVPLDERYVPPGVYLNPDHVVGRVPRTTVLANELIREERLADAKAGHGMHAFVPRRFRAVPVHVDGEPIASETYTHLLAPLGEGGAACVLMDAQYVLVGSEQGGERELLYALNADGVARLAGRTDLTVVSAGEVLSDLPKPMCPGVETTYPAK